MSVLNLMKTRRTYRRFEQRPVPDEVISEILEAARLSSSAAYLQPLKYLVIRTPELVAEAFPHTKWAGYLPPEQGVPRENERPTLFILALIDTDISKGSYSDTDAGIALANMTLAAWEKGVGSCIIGSCDRPWFMERFSLPETVRIHSVTAYGYPTHTSVCEDLTDSVKYYLDEAGNYRVPKRKISDTVRFC